MANIIQHKRSSTSGVIPAATGLSQGELAINIADGKLYTKNNINSIINLGVTSISGTYITPSSGNFFNYLAVNGIPVSVSGHSHLSVPQAQSLVTTVFNKTASTIPKFSAVYIDGGQGDQPTIQLAIAAGEGGSSRTYGITAETITSMNTGTVIVAGALSGVNTDQFNPTAPTGDVNGSSLYLSPTVSGGLTSTKPYAPNHLVYMATIVRTHQNEGVVEVRVQNGFELEELHNVATTGATNGQFLQYNASSGLWIPSSSGNFTTLSVNNTGVSLSGHTHSSSDITNFNSSVSGLLPTIANSGDNRVLTNTGSSVGINAESDLTFDGTSLSSPRIIATQASADEGGEFQLARPPSSSISGDIIIDAYQNKLRFFEQSGSNRGFYLDFSAAGGGASTNIGGSSAISNYANNRLITSDGTTTGLNAESNLTFDGSFLNVNGSGNFNALSVGNTGVSLTGHTHSSSSITDFNSSVSGLLPVKNIISDTNISISNTNGVFTISSSGSPRSTYILTHIFG